MNIEEMDFSDGMMPTVEQVRAVWDSIPEPSGQKVADWFARKQIEVSKRTVCNYKESGWAPVKARKRFKPRKKSGTKPKMATGGIKKRARATKKFYPPVLVVTDVHEAPKAAPQPEPKPQPQQAAPEPKPETAPEVVLDPRGVLGQLTPEQMNALLARIDTMFQNSVVELQATLKKRWLIMQILLAEYGAVASSQIACSPKDTAAFMSSSTEAVEHVGVASNEAAPIGHVTNGAANGNGNGGLYPTGDSAVLQFIRENKL